MESSIQKVSKKEKTFISLRAHGLSVYCFRLYKDLVKMMSMYVRDEKRQDIFYSLMTGTDISDLWGIERSGFFNDRGKWVKGFENQRV